MGPWDGDRPVHTDTSEFKAVWQSGMEICTTRHLFSGMELPLLYQGNPPVVISRSSLCQEPIIMNPDHVPSQRNSMGGTPNEVISPMSLFSR
mmetsp:Transcript_39589/g.53806  ORF Transcript_39589/g.53806 Transcript_39589/m.53806 type:complete len:92 (+) Transcript_39589:209-484(+)